MGDDEVAKIELLEAGTGTQKKRHSNRQKKAVSELQQDDPKKD